MSRKKMKPRERTACPANCRSSLERMAAELAWSTKAPVMAKFGGVFMVRLFQPSVA